MAQQRPELPSNAMLSFDASIGLVTLNARYVHLAPSLRYLRNAAESAGFTGVWLGEYTIQLPTWKLAAQIASHRPALLGFSIYIWNRQPTLALIERVKKQSPGTTIVVGGPEVSFEAEGPGPDVDYLIAGEGERKWVELLERLHHDDPPDAATLGRWATYGTDLPELGELPYREADFADLAHRLVYLETSRGCPYSCSFCLSALDKQVRFFGGDAVKDHIELLIARGARRIKFLDRTFNVRKRRVLELFRWLMGFEGVEFHFEVVGDLLDEEMLTLLEQAPPGMFQFEVGIQSAESEVLARIDRRQNTERLFSALEHLRRADRVHLHADLIWGLPGEGMADIRASFEAAVALRPHELQLGFLKFLPGAPIRRLIEPEGYVYQRDPPYEVISHRHLAADSVLWLKRFEDLFDVFYNSGNFRFALEALMTSIGPWVLFERLVEHYDRHELWLVGHSLDSRFGHLRECFAEGLPGGLSREILLDLLRLDYFYHRRAHRLPADLRDPGLDSAPDNPIGRAPGQGKAPEAARRPGGNSALVRLRHGARIEKGQALLRRREKPAWHVIAYPGTGQGYFFRPELTELD